jgi:putative endonuclease
MYYTYILKSFKNNFLYVGSCENFEQRIKLHNDGKVKSTKAYRPWGIVETRLFKTRSEAYKEEMFLKTGQQKELLRKKYCSNLENIN